MPPIPPRREPESAPDGHRLAREIIALSEAETWDAAKREWVLADVFFADKDAPGTCLCGHSPIIEHCVLRNRENGNQVIVGNVCVNKFMGLSSETLFQAIRRIAQDRSRALNAEMIDHAHRKHWLSDWERDFYLDTLRKRKLSAKQRAKRIEINGYILQHVSRNSEVV